MKALTVCLVFGLVLLTAWSSEAQSVAHAVPEICCFNFIDFAIPQDKVVSALKTSSHCPVEAVVVRTPRTEFCVKPDAPWLKNLKK